ncbi:DUF2187 family protein [Gottfriedia solisilvae]|uniref:DUF2187 family protein n=1 Tax=Gottfriedia solisilvae TaxID=1516104 RepID=UPI003D2F019B
MKKVEKKTVKKASEGDLISFNMSIHLKNINDTCEARVLKVMENSVIVDVRHENIYEFDNTVVNHKNYTILENAKLVNII